MEIRYLKRNEIDTQKWDRCIAHSVNGIVYAYSWFLDIVATDWDALVGEDYKAVFPLVFGNKYGYNYLYQPPFAQQLGLFSVGPLSWNLLKRFLNLAASRYSYLNLNLNTYLKIEANSFKTIPRKTFHLDLIEDYSKISGRFSVVTRNNISSSVANSVQVIRGLSAFQMLELKRNEKNNALKSRHIEMIMQIISTSVSNGTGELYGAYTSRNELCAAALFLRSNGKLVFLLSANSEEGTTINALHSIFDFVIHHHSEKHLVLDFGDAENEKMATFYKGYGASECAYAQLVINNLPANISLFK
ncbi:MAG TPA: hypothetical protein PL017_11280 [Tenuifilaceae bacterium]|nr:hypothetical protein [Tenuifilaceae bacterium]HPE19246.1 hypothetical protein [Tenuifilaceae bacterium]HPJ46672.1 hypothetical protein [Tenuifilaceae bacterium]HPQ34841.1 hypothetical protein [Tenuifilaceae bacterium]HRX69466.1 hypothetical protein [Tenuifilaceae bacterium]